MPKKKGQKKGIDFAIYQHIKEQQYEDLSSIKVETNAKKSMSKNYTSSFIKTGDDHGNVYPEIVWYWISAFIDPLDIASFAAINKAAYSITRRESFWYSIYNRYCKGHELLPERLRIDDTYKPYGLRQRVIRALYYTYGAFVDIAGEYELERAAPRTILKKKCISVWYSKGESNWKIYIKFKKSQIDSREIFEDKGRVWANPEEDNVVLLICSKNAHNIPPLMGMTLTSFCLSYTPLGLKIELGFKSPPETSLNFESLRNVILDTVIKWNIYDWWNPRYPHFEVKPPRLMKDEESSPILDVDFFDMYNN